MGIYENFAFIKERIKAIKEMCKLEENVIIMAAVKDRTTKEIEESFRCGVRFFGENRIQEGEHHLKELSEEIRKKIRYHFIGRLQKNKVKKAVMLFDSIDSVDSVEIVELIEKYSAFLNQKKDIMIEINLGEEQKGGVKIDNLNQLLKKVFNSPYITLTGIMGIPPFFEDASLTRPFFKKLYNIFTEIERIHPNRDSFKYLSMGMSHDFEVAVEEGASMVRIGTLIFGERRRKNDL